MLAPNPISSNSLSDISNFDDDSDKLEPQEQSSNFIDMSLTSAQTVGFRGPALLSSDASRWTGPIVASMRAEKKSEESAQEEPAKVIVQILVTPDKNKKGEVKVFVADCIGLNAAGNQTCSNIEHRFITNPPDRVRVIGLPQFEEWDIGKNGVTMTEKPTIPPIEEIDRIDNQTPVPTDNEFLQDLGKTESDFSKNSREKSIPITLEAANQFRAKNGYPLLTEKDVTSGFRLDPASPGHMTGHFDYSTKKLPNLDARLAEAKYVSKAHGASMQYLVEEKTPDGKQMNYLFVNGVQVKKWSGGSATATHVDVGPVMKTAPVEIKPPSENSPKNNQDPAKEKKIADDTKKILEQKNPIYAGDPSVSQTPEKEKLIIIKDNKESDPSKIAKINAVLETSKDGKTQLVKGCQGQNSAGEALCGWIKDKHIIRPGINPQPGETNEVLEVNPDNVFTADNDAIVDGDTKIDGLEDNAITSEKENLQKETNRIEKEKEAKRKAEEEKRRQKAEQAEKDRIAKGNPKSNPSGADDDPSRPDDDSSGDDIGIQGDSDDDTQDEEPGILNPISPFKLPPREPYHLIDPINPDDFEIDEEPEKPASESTKGTVEQVEIPDGPDDPEVGSGGMDPETEEK